MGMTKKSYTLTPREATFVVLWVQMGQPFENPRSNKEFRQFFQAMTLGK